jgi:hypothetical protein
MFFIHWLSRTSRRSQTARPPNRDRAKERRLKLLRLEQRRVLNADFTFVAHGLDLHHVDGDVTIREVSGSSGQRIEFDLTGSVWEDHGSTGLFAIDNSHPDHSILSVAKSDLESLSDGISLHAASSGVDLHFDAQSSPIDLSQMQGTLAAEGFGQIHQFAANDHEVRLGDASLSADHISLSRFHGDDIALNANEIDFTGGEHSVSGSTLSVLSAATPTIEIGGSLDHAHELNFTDSDLAALDATFHRISFESTSTDGDGLIHIASAGADFHNALTPGHDASLHLTADSIHIDGALSISGGLIDVSASHAATISETGSLVSHGGHVHVDAGESGTLLNSGHIDVSNTDIGGMGGTVHLLGEQVGLFGDAEVNASGHSGGGEVLIGGDLHGDGHAIPHAAHTYIGHDVVIHADATHSGNGGTIVAWSDEITQVYGSLSARGGQTFGDGGFIETSSHGQLLVDRGGDVSAPAGHAGTWLLDPFNIRIVNTLAVYQVTEFSMPPFFTPTIPDSEVTADAIQMELQTGATVVISTVNPDGTQDGDILQIAPINVTFDNAGDSGTLILTAANNITIAGGITASNGSLNVILEANVGSDDLNPASGNVVVNANIDTNGGFFNSMGVDFDSTKATILAFGGVSITHTGTVDLGAISTGMSFGGTTFISDANVHGAINVGEGNVLIDGGNDGQPDGANDDLKIMANITATGTVFLLADRDVIVEATVTAGGPTLPLDPSADLSITSDANADGDGGFWLREETSPADAQLNAGGNITIVGAKLFDSDGNPGGGTISLRIDAANVADDPQVIPQIIAGQDLTIVANFGNVSDAGDIVIDGIMQATEGSLTAFFTGTTSLSANQSAGTDLLFQNAVRLTNDVILTAGNDATIASTIDDDGNPRTASDLTVTAGGDVLFVGKIGGLADPGLDSLTVSGDGTIDFLNSVTVNGNLTVTETSETDRVTFQEAVTVTNGGSVTITNDGLLVIGSNADFLVAGSFMQQSSLGPPAGTGSTELGANITTANGDISFAQAVLLTPVATLVNDDLVLTTNTSVIDASNGNHNITFSGPIDSKATLTKIVDGHVVEVFEVLDGDVVTAMATHNSLTLIAGTGMVSFAGDIGDGFIDAGVGVIGNVDGNQELGNLTVQNAGMVLFNPVATVRTDGTIDLVAMSEIPSISIDGGFKPNGDPQPTTFQSHADIRINGNVTSQVDLFLLADGSITLTDGHSISTIANNSNVTVVADNDADTVGDFDMNAGTSINVGAGTIDLAGANLFLQRLISTRTNPTEIDVENSAIRGVATFQDIEVNDLITSDGGLFLSAIADITMTLPGRISTTTDRSNVTILADSDVNSAGEFLMTPGTSIVVADGFIDIHAAEASLGLLTSASMNATDADNPAIRVVATFRSINDNNGDDDTTGLNLRANQPGAGVVLDAVQGIGSGNLLETDIVSLVAFNHDGDPLNSTTPASGNIQIRDVGTTAGRVDLIFVRNQANATFIDVTRDAFGNRRDAAGNLLGVLRDEANGVIDISVEHGDLLVVDDESEPLLSELQTGINPSSPAVAAVQSENIIRLTADSIEIADDLLAIQDTAPAVAGIDELIEINARVNFVLDADRVITTDQNYAGSLILGSMNRSVRPTTIAEDLRVDEIHITADVNSVGNPNGSVLLGERSTISTDGGIEQQISPRPVKQPSDAQRFIYGNDSQVFETAFFSGEVLTSNLQFNRVEAGVNVYRATLTFKIGVSGEKNLVLDIDWGDATPAYRPNKESPSLSPTGKFQFDPSADGKATRFLIHEGGQTYVITHEYSQNALDLKNPAMPPGRSKTSDPLLVRFSVSQHPSVLIEGQSVFNPDGSGPGAGVDPDIPANAPSDTPTNPTPLTHDGLFLLSSTDVSDSPQAILPRFDNGVAVFTIPTAPAPPRLDPELPIQPPALPKPFVPDLGVIITPQLTTETLRSSAAASSISTDEFFEMQRTNPDGTVSEPERINGNRLLNREDFEDFVRDYGDGEYEIFFVTRDNKDGTKIRRAVIQFKLESGRLAAPANDTPELFQPFKLIPVLKPPPAQPVPANPQNPNGAAAEKNPDSQNDGTNQPSDDELSLLPRHDQQPDTPFAFSDAPLADGVSFPTSSPAQVEGDEFSNRDLALVAADTTDTTLIESDGSDSADTSALTAGMFLIAGTRWRKNRFNPFGASRFSKTARLARKRVVRADDTMR